MSAFVLDNSVTMRWLLEVPKKTDQQYAMRVLDSLNDQDALVPNLWHLEVANVLLRAEKGGDICAGDSDSFISQLENLPIHVDPITSRQAFSRTMNFARSYRLSSYDAAYLEISIREGIPIATLDKNIKKAANKAHVDIYEPSP